MEELTWPCETTRTEHAQTGCWGRPVRCVVVLSYFLTFSYFLYPPGLLAACLSGVWEGMECEKKPRTARGTTRRKGAIHDSVHRAEVTTLKKEKGSMHAAGRIQCSRNSPYLRCEIPESISPLLASEASKLTGRSKTVKGSAKVLASSVIHRFLGGATGCLLQLPL